ncbi:hypothetical protein [Flavobacterium aciduliphilum]|uniref:Uncharacterized protein n=1 Tax=Flavobacterium aciduliphilum TaxID=1101402 RepID=A0A328Y7N1_9FLAO|nr:hypothetical protein [Flavobacterium aciduliphilum]RAR70091.1 hypothetical protein CLV55_1123 [Flavobacterium aciduliphilum]
MSKNKIFWLFAFAMMSLNNLSLFAQDEKSFSLSDSDLHKEDIVMNWNKKTPESEMKEDVKALSEKGITIKFSGVKRNANDEITALKLEYSDRKGNKGSMEYNNQKPIPAITFYKNGEEIGFGEPNQFNNMIAGNDFMNGFTNPQDILKQFQLGRNNPNAQSFSFSFPNDGTGTAKSKSKIMIQKDGKKPLVIEDGKVVEGADDYSPEEIEKIKEENKIQQFDFSDKGNFNQEFDFRNQEGLDNFKQQMEQMRKNMPQNDVDNDMEQTKKEMIQAKEELIKAKEELEKAKKELQKTSKTKK